MCNLKRVKLTVQNMKNNNKIAANQGTDRIPAKVCYRICNWKVQVGNGQEIRTPVGQATDKKLRSPPTKMNSFMSGPS